MPAIGKQSFNLVINDDICHHCRRCLAQEVCQGHAFVMLDPEEGPFIDMSRCWGCLSCVITCPFGAIAKVEYGQAAAAD